MNFSRVLVSSTHLQLMLEFSVEILLSEFCWNSVPPLCLNISPFKLTLNDALVLWCWTCFFCWSLELSRHEAFIPLQVSQLFMHLLSWGCSSRSTYAKDGSCFPQIILHAGWILPYRGAWQSAYVQCQYFMGHHSTALASQGPAGPGFMLFHLTAMWLRSCLHHELVHLVQSSLMILLSFYDALLDSAACIPACWNTTALQGSVDPSSPLGGSHSELCCMNVHVQR